MATVERLLPRHWDGRRLLQFLTGLALIALAFALPAHLSGGRPAESSVPIVTTVDTPTPGLPVNDAPVGPDGNRFGLALDAAPAKDRTAAEATATDVTATATAIATATATATGPTETAGSGADAGSRRICVEARAAVDSTTPRSHGKRGPPRL